MCIRDRALVESMSVAADDGSVAPADVLQKGIVHLQQIEAHAERKLHTAHMFAAVTAP